MSRKDEVHEEIARAANLINVDTDVRKIALDDPIKYQLAFGNSINAQLTELIAELIDECEGIKKELSNINTSMGGLLK